MKKYFFITVFVIGMYGCSDTRYDAIHQSLAVTEMGRPVIPNVVVKYADSALHLVNGKWFYKGKIFSGFMETYFVTGVLKARQSFYMGKEEGLLTTYYENGSKDSRRFYHNGEKDSINQGWWINGKPRFEYHFKNGVYEGDFKEWYSNGKPLKHIIYQNGKEQSGKGWRANGKAYMSFVMRDGRLYGLVNPNLCYSLKNERGEYITNTP